MKKNKYQTPAICYLIKEHSEAIHCSGELIEAMPLYKLWDSNDYFYALTANEVKEISAKIIEVKNKHNEIMAKLLKYFSTMPIISKN